MGKEVVEVIPGEKKLLFRDGSHDAYDTLLIASGSKPIVRKIKGLEETGYITLHTFYDYRAIKKALEKKGLKEKGNVVIYGGGLVAAELTIPLLEVGVRVELVIRSRLLRSYVNPDVGNRIEEILINQGAQVHKGCTVQELKRNAHGVEYPFPTAGPSTRT